MIGDAALFEGAKFVRNQTGVYPGISGPENLDRHPVPN